MVREEYRKLAVPRLTTLFEADHEAAVNARMAFEVLRDGRGADVLDAQDPRAPPRRA